MCVCIVAAREQANAWLHSEQQFKQNHPLHTIQYQPITTTADNHQPSIINTHTIHIIITPDNKITPIAVCAVRDEKFPQQQINSTAKTTN